MKLYERICSDFEFLRTGSLEFLNSKGVIALDNTSNAKFFPTPYFEGIFDHLPLPIWITIKFYSSLLLRLHMLPLYAYLVFWQFVVTWLQDIKNPKKVLLFSFFFWIKLFPSTCLWTCLFGSWVAFILRDDFTFLFFIYLLKLDKFGAAMMVVKSDIGGNISVRFSSLATKNIWIYIYIYIVVEILLCFYSVNTAL